MYQLIALALTVALSAGAPFTQLSPVQRAGAGWDALRAGRAQEAAAAFEQVLREAPQEPTVLFGAGLAAHLLGQSDPARRFLLDALKYDPKLTDASVVLGEVLYRSNDINAAITTYEQALVHAPAHTQLLERVDAWRKEAALHDRFGQKLGEHFTVLFEGPAEAELAQKSVAILEAAYWRIGGALFTYPSDVITVVLYTREQFRDVTQSPEWAGGLYDGRIRMPVRGALDNPREFARVLAHEFTHALVYALAPRAVPVWLNEGLAVNFEGTDVNAKAAQLKEAVTRPPLADLERSFGKLDAAGATLAYAQSAVAVQLLLEEAGASAIVGMLADVGRGVPFADAFLRHTNMSYPDFQKRVHGT
ncbi:MAG: tetratricopeptide repeat protein [Vicinamibacterales bacterium]